MIHVLKQNTIPPTDKYYCQAEARKWSNPFSKRAYWWIAKSVEYWLYLPKSNLAAKLVFEVPESAIGWCIEHANPSTFEEGKFMITNIDIAGTHLDCHRIIPGMSLPEVKQTLFDLINEYLQHSDTHHPLNFQRVDSICHRHDVTTDDVWEKLIILATDLIDYLEKSHRINSYGQLFTVLTQLRTSLLNATEIDFVYCSNDFVGRLVIELSNVLYLLKSQQELELPISQLLNNIKQTNLSLNVIK